MTARGALLSVPVACALGSVVLGCAAAAPRHGQELIVAPRATDASRDRLVVRPEPEPAAGEPGERTRGLSIGAGLTGNLASSRHDRARETGAGLAVRAGYDFTEHVGVYLQGAHAKMESYGLGYWDLGMRIRFLPAARLKPYVEGGYSDHTMVEDRQDYSRGSAVTAGTGVQIYVSRRLSMAASVSHTRGRITDTRGGSDPWVPLGGDGFTLSSTRLGLAAVHHR